MLVYVKNTYGSVTGNKFYLHSLLTGESRNTLKQVKCPMRLVTGLKLHLGGAISTLVILET